MCTESFFYTIRELWYDLPATRYCISSEFLLLLALVNLCRRSGVVRCRLQSLCGCRRTSHRQSAPPQPTAPRRRKPSAGNSLSGRCSNPHPPCSSVSACNSNLQHSSSTPHCHSSLPHNTWSLIAHSTCTHNTGTASAAACPPG